MGLSPFYCLSLRPHLLIDTDCLKLLDYETETDTVGRGAIPCSFYIDYFSLFLVGICTCYFRCAEQAFPGGACHDEGSFRFYPGDDVYWLFRNGCSCRIVHKPFRVAQGSGFRVAAVRYRFVAVYSRAILSVIQYVLVCPFCHRLWIDIP